MLVESKFSPRDALLAFVAITIAATLRAAPIADDPEGRALLQAAQRIIAGYHDGHRDAHNVLRVVYFHPSDRDPLPNYSERLDRVMTDVSDFYRDGLRRFGIKNDGLPLERKDGRLVLHVVRGKKTASEYQHEPGSGYEAVTEAHEAVAEIHEAMKGTFDMDREWVLVIYGLCRREPDGRYVFDAPYFGEGWRNPRQGICHAADCELLDPVLLTETKRRIAYAEHHHARMEQTVAAFNTWYIGGIAHELGHGLGFAFHDAGNPAESRFGVSLMGTGNRNYREDVWGGASPAYLSRAFALHLASHPLFTGSDRGRWDDAQPRMERMGFASTHGALEIHGKVDADVPAYAVIVQIWPVQADEHNAQMFPAVLRDDEFSIRVNELRPNRYAIRLVTLYVNGATTAHEYQFGFDGSGNPDIVTLNTAWLIERAEAAVAANAADARTLLTDVAMVRAVTPEAQRKLRVLREALEPATPFELASIKTDRAFLSDAVWLDAKVGWGQPARNHYWFDEKIQNGVLLALGGEFFDKALYAHSPSRYAFALDGRWRKFTATVGLRDGATDQGSAIFTVRGDGRELFRSMLLRVGARQEVNVDVFGVKTLELVADSGWEHNYSSWAIWAEPMVRR